MLQIILACNTSKTESFIQENESKNLILVAKNKKFMQA